MNNENWWTLNEEEVKVKPSQKVKKTSRKSSKKNVENGARFYKDDVAVAAAQVMELFEKNKTKIYTNKDIANELGLSEGTVTGVTTRLEALRKIKIVEILQRVSAYTVYYQHIAGPSQRVNKRRGIDGNKKDTSQLMLELFEEDKNKVFAKKELVEILKAKGESEGQIDTSLRILLLGQDVKVVGEENQKGLYQHVDGNKKGLKVYRNTDESYCSVPTFIKESNFKGSEEALRRNLPKSYRLFYSSKGQIKEYLREDLKKSAKKAQKKSFIERMFN